MSHFVTSIRLPDEMREKLDFVATQTQRKRNWLMVEAIKRYIDDEWEEMQFLQDADKNLAELNTLNNGLSLDEFATALGIQKDEIA